jgi:hypothetical protein
MDLRSGEIWPAGEARPHVDDLDELDWTELGGIESGNGYLHGRLRQGDPLGSDQRGPPLAVAPVRRSSALAEPPRRSLADRPGRRQG